MNDKPTTKTFRTADIIRHIPTGEEWTVATVDKTHIGCVGWPYTLAPFEDVELVVAADDAAHLRLLRSMANMSVPDPRRSYARAMISTHFCTASTLPGLDTYCPDFVALRGTRTCPQCGAPAQMLMGG